jgi:hypothetical protein
MSEIFWRGVILAIVSTVPLWALFVWIVVRLL